MFGGTGGGNGKIVEVASRRGLSTSQLDSNSWLTQKFGQICWNFWQFWARPKFVSHLARPLEHVFAKNWP